MNNSSNILKQHTSQEILSDFQGAHKDQNMRWLKCWKTIKYVEFQPFHTHNIDETSSYSPSNISPRHQIILKCASVGNQGSVSQLIERLTSDQKIPDSNPSKANSRLTNNKNIIRNSVPSVV